MIENIDAADVENELAVAEYVDEMYTFYKHTEVLLLYLLCLSHPISSVSV